MASAAFNERKMPGAEFVICDKVDRNYVLNLLCCDFEILKDFDFFYIVIYNCTSYIIASKSSVSNNLICQWLLNIPLTQNVHFRELHSHRLDEVSTVTPVKADCNFNNVCNTRQTKLASINHHHPRHGRNHSLSTCPRVDRGEAVRQRLKRKLHERKKHEQAQPVSEDGATFVYAQAGAAHSPNDDQDNAVKHDDNDFNNGDHLREGVSNLSNDAENIDCPDEESKVNQPTASCPCVHKDNKSSSSESASRLSSKLTDLPLRKHNKYKYLENKCHSKEYLLSDIDSLVQTDLDHIENRGSGNVIRKKQKKPFRNKSNDPYYEDENSHLDYDLLSIKAGKTVDYMRVKQELRDLTNLPSSHMRRDEFIVYPAKKSKGGGKSGHRRGQAGRDSGASRSSEDSPELPIQVTDTSPESLNRPPRELIVTSSQSVFGSLEGSSAPLPAVTTLVQEQALRDRIRGVRNPAVGQDRSTTNPRYPNYDNSTARQQSFSNWPVTTGQDPTRMTTYGFFYSGQADLIRCFQCGIGLKDWSQGDEPLFEHIRHSPQCAFLKNLLGNDLLTAYRENMNMNGSQPPENNTAPPQNDTNRIRNPRYESLPSRLESFTEWPAGSRQEPQALAEAGLFYTGFNDLCRCYCCDGGLQRWEEEDEPWVEHARWFPNCNYVKRIKGQAYINMVRRAAEEARREEEDSPVYANKIREIQLGSRNISTRNNTATLSGAINNMRLSNREIGSAAYGALELGFSRIAILQAIGEYHSKNGNNNYTSEDLIKILTARVDRGEELPKDPQDADPPLLDPAAENRRLKGIVKCMMCRVNDSNMLFLPCTHHRLCESCAERVVECPVCHQKIEDKIRTYMS